MNRILSVAFAAALAVSVPQAGVAQVPAGDRARATGPARADERITLHLRAAKATDVLELLADMMRVTPDIDPAIDQRLSMKLNNVTIRTMLTALCGNIGCQWRFDDKSLVVRRSTRPDPDGSPANSTDPSGSRAVTTGSVRLQGAALPDVLDFIAEFFQGGFVMDEALAGRKVNVDLKDVTWQEALDLICAQAGCRWTVFDTSRMILVRPR